MYLRLSRGARLRSACVHAASTTLGPDDSLDASPGCEDLDALAAAHARHLTPAHLRANRGGRQPSADPRTDPAVGLLQARRILKNRLSATRSKQRKKAAAQVTLCRRQYSAERHSWNYTCVQIHLHGISRKI